MIKQHFNQSRDFLWVGPFDHIFKTKLKRSCLGMTENFWISATFSWLGSLYSFALYSSVSLSLIISFSLFSNLLLFLSHLLFHCLALFRSIFSLSVLLTLLSCVPFLGFFTLLYSGFGFGAVSTNKSMHSHTPARTSSLHLIFTFKS